jgi:hypothetical protein
MNAERRPKAALVAGVATTTVTETPGQLSSPALAELQQHEAVIERVLGTFVEVGTALAAIRDGRLYRATHGTFEDYCCERWNLSRPSVYRMIKAAETVEALSPMGDIPAIANERQARAIASTLKQHGPEVAAEVLREAATDTLTAASIITARERVALDSMCAGMADADREFVTTIVVDELQRKRERQKARRRHKPTTAMIRPRGSVMDAVRVLRRFYSADEIVKAAESMPGKPTDGAR